MDETRKQKILNHTENRGVDVAIDDIDTIPLE